VLAEDLISISHVVEHVAHPAALDRLRTQGLRTAEQLIDDSNVPDARKSALSTTIRWTPVELPIGDSNAMLRDQARLRSERALEARLGPGLTVADWVALLNQRVYLFTTTAERDRLLSKYVELDGGQLVLGLSTRRLLDVAGDRVELAAQNTGAIPRTKSRTKTREVFQRWRSFPSAKRPAEFTIVDGLSADELAATVLRVEVHRPAAAPERLEMPFG
jgi:hypothetical protein